MQDIKAIVAKNIAALRGAREMTQLELAEKLNYSEKPFPNGSAASRYPTLPF